VVSHPEVSRRLQQFVCVRLDWDQMTAQRERWRGLTQGNQVLLTSAGEIADEAAPHGRRYPIDELLPLLDRILAAHPAPAPPRHALRLEWFWWNPKRQGYPGHFGAEAVAKLDRKPVLTVSGPLPAWLGRDPFLRRHLRQFIWTRGSEDGEATLTVRMLEPHERELLSVSLAETDARRLGEALDAAWLEYMRLRPLVARGYIDNPYGNWLKGVMERAAAEEIARREQALTGTLRPPGRE